MARCTMQLPKDATGAEYRKPPASKDSTIILRLVKNYVYLVTTYNLAPALEKNGCGIPLGICDFYSDG